MSRANQWFVPGEEIAREVITADIQRYLGPDALVRPGVGNAGEYQGRPGYWITAYRTLTSQMIQDLKMDSQRWREERIPGEAGRGVAYQDSRTHAARQHWGPSKPFDHPSEPAYEQPPRQASTSSRGTYAPSNYASSESSHYTTAPTTPYGASSVQGYQSTTGSAAPRTQPADPYSAYQQPAERQYAAQSGYSSYPTQGQSDPYGRTPAASSSQYAPSTAAQPGYYIASDGRQYPLSQQPTSRNPQQGASKRY